MRIGIRSALVGIVVFAAGLPTAKAQSAGLGGFGGMSGGSSMDSGPVAPFGGRFGTVMGSGMGSGGDLSFRPRSSSVMSPSRTAFTIGPAGAMSGGASLGSSRRPFSIPSLAAPRPRMAIERRMSVMPPSFGSPFRQPPSLSSPSPIGSGMSM